jgi:hypothetical protein
MIYRPGCNSGDYLKSLKKDRRIGVRSQTIIEYTLMLGILIAVLVGMTPWIRRGVQAMVRMVADQVGNQVNAEQRFDRSGHMVNSYTVTEINQDLNVSEYLGTTVYTYNQDDVLSVTNSMSNLGYKENN